MRIAVIGSGISGNVIARMLTTDHEVHLFEANRHIGGHALTVDVPLAGREHPVDVGFMVCNERTYPNFFRLLKWLGIETRDSDMSLSVRCEKSGLEFQGSSLNGIFAQRRNLFRPGFYRMIADILRFNRLATEAVQQGDIPSDLSVGEFLRRCGCGLSFVDHYLVPMSAAIWSADPRKICDFPAHFILGFYHNHGLLQLRNRPQWKTIIGGSRRYVAALLEPLQDRIHVNCPIRGVTRRADHVLVETSGNDVHVFDEVIFACHSDQALHILTDPAPAEMEVLSAFPYQPNEAVLHTDTSMLPRSRRAWASWNYTVPVAETEAVSVTYDLSRLQGHDSHSPILLTLNRESSIRPDHVIRKFMFHHPLFSRRSIDAQRRHSEINGVNRTHFCGAYWRYGFHEDGVVSALQVGRYFGKDLESCTAESTEDRLLTAGCTR